MPSTPSTPSTPLSAAQSSGLEPCFTPFVPRQQDDSILVLSVSPTWAARLGKVSARLMQAVCWLAIPGVAYLIFTRDKGVAAWAFGLFAIGALVFVAKMMKFALQLEDVTGVRLDTDGLTVITGKGRDAETEWLPREEATGLRLTRGVTRYKGQVRSRWIQLRAERVGGRPVYLGWIQTRGEDDVRAELAVADIAKRLGVPILESNDAEQPAGG